MLRFTNKEIKKGNGKASPPESSRARKLTYWLSSERVAFPKPSILLSWKAGMASIGKMMPG